MAYLRRSSLALAALLPFVAADAWACTRVLWADNEQAVVVGRNMDWKNPMPVDLWTLPRGLARDGMTGANTVHWVARYGSLVAAKDGASDGVNERGLAAHLLWLSESTYGKRDPQRPGLSSGLWLQYVLDNFATVNDAVTVLQAPPFQLVTGVYDGETIAVHLAIEDASGDSAIIEYIDGKPRVYHGRQYTVLTNSPPYDQQLERLRRYAGFGGAQPLPGSTEPADRFVRAAYYLKHLPPPASYREAIAGVLSVMRNVAQPFGTSDPARPNVSATRWRTTIDLTHGVYYFESTTSPNIVWVRLDKLDLHAGASVKRLDLIHHPDRVGDVSADLAPATPFTVPPPQQ